MCLGTAILRGKEPADVLGFFKVHTKIFKMKQRASLSEPPHPSPAVRYPTPTLWSYSVLLPHLTSAI